MYFYKSRGKQHLDLRGVLVFSHNPTLVRARVKSAAPAGVHNAKSIVAIPAMSWRRKWSASWAALRFIWGPDESLRKETIDKEGI